MFKIPGLDKNSWENIRVVDQPTLNINFAPLPLTTVLIATLLFTVRRKTLLYLLAAGRGRTR